jgi:hypothetical protein
MENVILNKNKQELQKTLNLFSWSNQKCNERSYVI